MIRITDIMKNNTLIRNTGRHQTELDKVEKQLATGQRINQPSDDPGIATNQMFFRTRLDELEQFDRNLDTGVARLNQIDGNLSNVTDILQRVRVLAVQASNGIYGGDNAFELKHAIAQEIDQHLRALIELGNGQDGTGRSLFGGHVTETRPFEIIESSIPGLKEGVELPNMIVAVNYNGDIGKQLREVERGQYIDVNLPGNQAFWGTNMTLTGSVDNAGYTAQTDQRFKIDGHEVRVAPGDTIDDIIEKINQLNIDVKASKIGQDFLSLNTTSPHQIWLEDVEGGTVLQDVGLIDTRKPSPPNNYSESARVAGGSLFDVLIKLRNDLLSADQLEISGRDLGNLDETINNVLRHRTAVGARQNRIEEHQKRIAWDKNYTTELLAKSEGIDFAETIMNMKWLETVHNYSLNVGARIIRPSLIDFLR